MRNGCLGLEYGGGCGCGSLYLDVGWAGCLDGKNGRQDFGVDRKPTATRGQKLNAE